MASRAMTGEDVSLNKNDIKEADACISVERTVKVLKEDATRACHSTNPFDFGLADLDMNDVTEIWETLKSEGIVNYSIK